ncbi:MAG: hypothetical protein HY766_08725 [candidate division NC10 bacterium]|nr:hypothetical protein [candidate division NC10 bacterium]
MDDSIVSASPPPPADGGSGGGSHESGLVNLTRSYVDKLTRATPDEREKLRAAQKRMSASRPAPTRRERSGLASTVTNPLDEVDFNDRLSAALGWVESLKRSGKDMTRTEQALTRIERLFYVNRMKAAQKLDQVLGFLARAEAGPSAAESGHRPRGLRDEADSPVNDGMDQRWRALRNQVAAVRGQVRLLRARVANLEAAITNPARPSFVPVVERVVVEPTLVRGGEPARISLSIRYPAGARPRVAWRSRDGHLVTWRDAAAVWWAPPVPGTYTIQVSIGSQSGPAVSEEIEVEVYQPGRISYSPAHLDERLSILNICLGQLRDEHSQLKKRLEALQGKAPSSPTPSIAGLETAPPLLTVSTPAEPGLGVQVFADLVSGAAPQVQVTAGSCIATAGSGARWEGVWNREARGDWEVVTAEWRPNAPFHWLSSIALGAERSE